MAAAAKPKIIAIVGPTASGKTDLAIKVALRFNGEVISADSLTIYKGMDIGTAKPKIKDRQKIPHWGFDLVEPDQQFSAYQFKNYAQNKIADINKRNKLPILAGGTGLYVDSVLFDFGFGAPPDQKKRAELAKLSVEKLQSIIRQKSLPMPKNAQNPRHLIRVIESGGLVEARKIKPSRKVLLIGLKLPDEILKEKIAKRVEAMFKEGLIEETKKLIDKYGKEIILSKTKVAYGPIVDYLSGSIDINEAKKQLISAHWQFARRQKIYFKRNPYIQWFSSADEAYKHIAQTLSN
jgi:tRNA dimethylallyltransferase